MLEPTNYETDYSILVASLDMLDFSTCIINACNILGRFYSILFINHTLKM